MAIAYENTTTPATAVAGSSLQLSLTTAGTNKLAILALGWASGTYTAPATITVGGSAATEIVTKSYYGGTRFIALYRFIAPPDASTEYAATWGGTVDDAALGVITYSGVDQTTPISGSTSSGDESNTNATITISSATGEVVVTGLHCRYPANSASENGGQTERVYAANWGGNDAVFAMGEEAGAASVTQSWLLTNAGIWALTAARLNPAAASAPTISDAGDEVYYTGETGIVITGTGFGASQGGGTVKISPTDNVANSAAITQTVTSWADTSITFTAVKNSGAYTLPSNTNCYLFVTNNSSQSNASGHVVQVNLAPIVMKSRA